MYRRATETVGTHRCPVVIADRASVALWVGFCKGLVGLGEIFAILFSVWDTASLAGMLLIVVSILSS